MKKTFKTEHPKVSRCNCDLFLRWLAFRGPRTEELSRLTGSMVSTVQDRQHRKPWYYSYFSALFHSRPVAEWTYNLWIGRLSQIFELSTLMTVQWCPDSVWSVPLRADQQARGLSDRIYQPAANPISGICMSGVKFRQREQKVRRAQWRTKLNTWWLLKWVRAVEDPLSSHTQKVLYENSKILSVYPESSDDVYCARVSVKSLYTRWMGCKRDFTTATRWSDSSCRHCAAQNIHQIRLTLLLDLARERYVSVLGDSVGKEIRKTVRISSWGTTIRTSGTGE